MLSANAVRSSFPFGGFLISTITESVLGSSLGAANLLIIPFSMRFGGALACSRVLGLILIVFGAVKSKAKILSQVLFKYIIAIVVITNAARKAAVNISFPFTCFLLYIFA